MKQIKKAEVSFLQAGGLVLTRRSERRYAELRVIIVLFLCLFSFSFAYAQPGEESDCDSNIENIFKALSLKIRYETVQYVYQTLDIKDSIFIRNKHSPLSYKPSLNKYFRSITGFPMDDFEESVTVKRTEEIKFPGQMSLEEFKRENDSLVRTGGLPVERISEEDMYQYLKQLNCTPGEALKEYRDFIRNIKAEKEIYLKCIDAELAKGDLSEDANRVRAYNFHPPWSSILAPPPYITNSGFLKVFKEFILNDDNYITLPEGLIVVAYLKCGCKMSYPFFP